MIKKGSQYIALKAANVAYCYADDKLCFAVDNNGVKYMVMITYPNSKSN